jgi:hypothetical protein
MPKELDQPVVAITPDAAISALLYLFQLYASEERPEPSSRLKERIYRHLENLSQREDLPAILQKTCDELYDAWLLKLDRRPARLS